MGKEKCAGIVNISISTLKILYTVCNVIFKTYRLISPQLVDNRVHQEEIN